MKVSLSWQVAAIKVPLPLLNSQLILLYNETQVILSQPQWEMKSCTCNYISIIQLQPSGTYTITNDAIIPVWNMADENANNLAVTLNLAFCLLA